MDVKRTTSVSGVLSARIMVPWCCESLDLRMALLSQVAVDNKFS